MNTLSVCAYITRAPTAAGPRLLLSKAAVRRSMAERQVAAPRARQESARGTHCRGDACCQETEGDNVTRCRRSMHRCCMSMMCCCCRRVMHRCCRRVTHRCCRRVMHRCCCRCWLGAHAVVGGRDAGWGLYHIRDCNPLKSISVERLRLGPNTISTDGHGMKELQAL